MATTRRPKRAPPAKAPPTNATKARPAKAPDTNAANPLPKERAPKTATHAARGFVLERSIELEVEIDDGDAYDVRIELLRSRGEANTFRGRLWRHELYRIQSTFPQRPNGEPADPPSDELIMKEWEGVPLSFDSFTAKDLDSAEAHVLERLDAWLENVHGRIR